MTRALALALTLAAATAFAQPRHGPTLDQGPVTVQLVAVERCSGDRARETLVSHAPAVMRCFDEARRRDPRPLASVRRVEVLLRLDAHGGAEVTEFEPPLLSRGLSACLADALLSWRQSGPVSPRAAVRLAIVVDGH